MLRKDSQKLIYMGQLVWSWLLIVNYRDLHLVKQSFTKFILICNLHMPYITYWILSVPKLSTIYIMYTSIYIYMVIRSPFWSDLKPLCYHHRSRLRCGSFSPVVWTCFVYYIFNFFSFYLWKKNNVFHFSIS